MIINDLLQDLDKAHSKIVHLKAHRKEFNLDENDPLMQGLMDTIDICRLYSVILQELSRKNCFNIADEDYRELAIYRNRLNGDIKELSTKYKIVL